MGLLVGVVIYVHNVPKGISQEDKDALITIFDEDKVNAKELSFEDQINYIDKLVNKLHGQFKVLKPIQYNHKREPLQLIENGGGYCYDFSRSIEKQLIISGFKTRHAAVYLRKGSFFQTLSSKDVTSHSVCEVLTKNGWMVIDSNEPFYTQDVNGEVYSFKNLKDLEVTPTWKISPSRETSKFYWPKIEYVYGLYSRHGYFYAPYNAIPDYNFRELFYNF